jgi:peptidoglycan/LPS O-acetylase OafA/YrhL
MTERNQSLDLLRGVAILLVLLVHCAQATTSVIPGLTWFALEYGELGVQLFFLVSGYTMMLRVELAAARSFYIRRRAGRSGFSAPFAVRSLIAVRFAPVGRRFRCVSLLPACQRPGVEYVVQFKA